MVMPDCSSGRVLGLVVVVPNWSSGRWQDLSSFIGRDGF